MDDRPLPPDWVFIAIRVFFGGLFAVPGLLLIGTAAGIMDAIPWASMIPFWAALLIGLPFVSMGVMIASGLKSFGDEDASVPAGIKLVLLLTFLVPLALVFLWTGFGPGEREFTVITTIGDSETIGTGDELTGRFLFGGSGVFMAMVILLYVRSYFKRGRR